MPQAVPAAVPHYSQPPQQPQQHYQQPPPQYAQPLQPRPQTFTVIVPQGCGPGMQLQVRAPNTGQVMTVIIPQGVGPGMQFGVPLPAAAPQPAYHQPQQYQQFQQPPRYY